MQHKLLIENTEKRYAQKISCGEHTLYADLPQKKRGDDTGLAPYDLLLSALGSCTSITLQMYAERKEITLTHVAVELEYLAEDRRLGTAARIERKIHLEGDFTEQQHQRMLEIADRCPVHKTLVAGVEVKSELV